MTEHTANKALAANKRNAQLMAERKPLQFSTTKQGNKNKPSTWSLV